MACKWRYSVILEQKILKNHLKELFAIHAHVGEWRLNHFNKDSLEYVTGFKKEPDGTVAYALSERKGEDEYVSLHFETSANLYLESSLELQRLSLPKDNDAYLDVLHMKFEFN